MEKNCAITSKIQMEKKSTINPTNTYCLPIIDVSTHKAQLGVVKIKGWKSEYEKELKDLINVKSLTCKCYILLSYPQRV